MKCWNLSTPAAHWSSPSRHDGGGTLVRARPRRPCVWRVRARICCARRSAGPPRPTRNLRVITATMFAACVASLAANAEAQDAQQGTTVAYTIAANDGAGSPTRSDGALYPNITIHNYSPWGLQVWVHYTLNSCDTKWLPVSISRRDAAGTFIPGGMAAAAKYNSGENACLISSITVQADGAPKEVQVTNYQSTGTSYREFYFLPAPPEVELGTVQTQKYWQLYSASEANVPNQGKTGMSPGFVITNKTKWPLAVTLDQVGCLYRD